MADHPILHEHIGAVSEVVCLEDHRQYESFVGAASNAKLAVLGNLLMTVDPEERFIEMDEQGTCLKVALASAFRALFGRLRPGHLLNVVSVGMISNHHSLHRSEVETQRIYLTPPPPLAELANALRGDLTGVLQQEFELLGRRIDRQLRPARRARARS